MKTNTTGYYPSVFVVIFVLTATRSVVFAVFLGVSFESTMETMLPELRKPRVPVVILWTKLQVVVIKPLHVCRLELYSNTTSSFSDITICNIIPVCPPITVKKHSNLLFTGFHI